MRRSFRSLRLLNVNQLGKNARRTTITVWRSPPVIVGWAEFKLILWSLFRTRFSHWWWKGEHISSRWSYSGFIGFVLCVFLGFFRFFGQRFDYVGIWYYLWLSSCMSAMWLHKARLPELKSCLVRLDSCWESGSQFSGSTVNFVMFVDVKSINILMSRLIFK